jgi:two-component system, chemotaxis family, protein-glutamate methylesterase/glutaminase
MRWDLGRTPGQVVVIGGSAGSIEVLKLILADLDPSMNAAVIVVVHVSPDSRSRLPDILSRAGRMHAVHVRRDLPLEAGLVYIAPPDQHIAVTMGRICPLAGPRVNRTRPAIDPMFISAARAYGPHVIGVLLSGYLDDGVQGLVAIKERGGRVIVQDPSSTPHPDMPLNAVQRVTIDELAPPERIGSVIMQNLNDSPNGSAEPSGQAGTPLTLEELIGEEGDPRPQPDIQLAAMSCPECNGVLQAMDGPDPVRFRCRVGHAYSLDALLAAKSDEIEAALWTAVRALEEKAEMSRSLAARMERRHAEIAVRRHIAAAARLQGNADLLRTLLATNAADSEGDLPESGEVSA